MFLFAGLKPVREDVAVLGHGRRRTGGGFTFYGAIVRWLDAFERRTAQLGFTAAVAGEFGFQFDSVCGQWRTIRKSSACCSACRTWIDAIRLDVVKVWGRYEECSLSDARRTNRPPEVVRYRFVVQICTN